jgi:hypothetical protein
MKRGRCGMAGDTSNSFTILIRQLNIKEVETRRLWQRKW